MELNKVLYEAPEMTEDKLLEIIKSYIKTLRKQTIKDLQEIHKDYFEENLPRLLYKEFDIINRKESKLSKSRRDEVAGLVSYCLIKMTKDNERKQSQD